MNQERIVELIKTQSIIFLFLCPISDKCFEIAIFQILIHVKELF